MKIKIMLLTSLLFLSFSNTSCVSKKTVSDDDFALEDKASTGGDLTLDDSDSTTSAAGSSGSSTDSSSVDDFADFENGKSSDQQNVQGNEQIPQMTTNNELKPDDSAQQNAVVSQNNETQDQTSSPQPSVEQPTDQLTSSQTGADTVVSQPMATEIAKIKDLKFLGNENGGTLVISAEQALQFKTRMNARNNQLVVEVQNAVIPERLKRPLNTKDMTSTIGGIDVYQNAGSKIARFVIQLRPNSPEPVVQPEGNSILVVGSLNPALNKENAVEAPLAQNQSNESRGASDDDGLGILGSESLEDFLANNNKYYGRKINFEVTGMDTRDALKFIAEESGINLVIDNTVTASTVTVKLRNVPWDQVLVTILKTNRLAYRRQGDVIRIGSMASLIEEETEAIQLKKDKEETEPLIVKNFPINYADIAALETKVKDFIEQTPSTQNARPAGQAGAATAGGANNQNANNNANRGKVTSDLRTNVLIVTETASRLKQVEKLIQLLDKQPQQVLIEARIVEASESYAKSIGMNFCTNSSECGITNSNRISSTLNNTGLTISPSVGNSPPLSGTFKGSLWLGTLGSFGDLSTTLQLDESENKIKILSSPRIYVLHGASGEIAQDMTVLVDDPQTTVTGGVTTVTPKKPVNIGINLSVKPSISNVGTVMMDLFLRKSALDAKSNTTSRNVKTNIVVKSGDTAIVGGVYTTDSSMTGTGIPWLRDIPILGWFFKSENYIKSKTELMFFISPKILNEVISPVQASSKEDSSSL